MAQSITFGKIRMSDQERSTKMQMSLQEMPLTLHALLQRSLDQEKKISMIPSMMRMIMISYLRNDHISAGVSSRAKLQILAENCQRMRIAILTR